MSEKMSGNSSETNYTETEYREAYEREHLKCADLASSDCRFGSEE